MRALNLRASRNLIPNSKFLIPRAAYIQYYLKKQPHYATVLCLLFSVFC